MKNYLSAKDQDHDLNYGLDLDIDLHIHIDLDLDLDLVGNDLLWALFLSNLDSLHKIFRIPYLSAKDCYHDLHLDLHIDRDLGLDIYHDLDI